MALLEKEDVVQVWSVSALPIAISVGLLIIYLIELLLAGSFEYDAAYAYITSVQGYKIWIVRFASPLLHSNHSHILGNSLSLSVVGSIILTHRGKGMFLIVFFASSWFLAFLVGGFGMSGGIAAISGWEVLTRYHDIYRIDSNELSMKSRAFWKNVAFVFLPFLIISGYSLVWFGLIEGPEGANDVGHFLGVIIGVTVGLVDILSR